MYNHIRFVKLKLYEFSFIFSTQIYNLWRIDRNNNFQYHFILIIFTTFKIKTGGQFNEKIFTVFDVNGFHFGSLFPTGANWG